MITIGWLQRYRTRTAGIFSSTKDKFWQMGPNWLGKVHCSVKQLIRGYFLAYSTGIQDLHAMLTFLWQWTIPNTSALVALAHTCHQQNLRYSAKRNPCSIGITILGSVNAVALPCTAVFRATNGSVKIADMRFFQDLIQLSSWSSKMAIRYCSAVNHNFQWACTLVLLVL